MKTGINMGQSNHEHIFVNNKTKKNHERFNKDNLTPLM
jgi:hypothetical protein